MKVEDKKTEKPKEEIKKVEIKTETKVEEKKVEPTTSKIKCSNCSEEFDRIMHIDVNKTDATVNCPKCLAILKQDGTMIYPPQIIDFKVSCPSCRMGSWLLLSRNDKEANVRCSCKKEYKINFSEEKQKEMLDKIQFPYSGSTNCPQCEKWIYYEGISGITSRDMKCKKCGLVFSFDINKVKEHKKISKIEEIEIKKIEKSSEKGGKQTMEFTIEISKYHRYVDDFEKSVATLPGDYGESTEVAERLTTEQRNALPDNSFAVVIRVKDKKTGKMRKVRMFSINDKAHVKNALARLGQSALQATLKRLGVSIDKVRAKILRRAKQLEITALLEQHKKASVKKTTNKTKVETKPTKAKEVEESPKVEVKPKTEETPKTEEKVEAKLERYKTGVKKIARKYRDLRKSMNDKIDFYKKNAVEINKRRDELEDFAKDLTDEQILNDDKFEKAKLEKENSELKINIEKSSETVAIKGRDNDYYTKKKKEIDAVAFKKIKKDK